jgi:phosphoglycolate phosphatase
MPFNAILFDLDGTLLDTLEDLADSTNAALAGLGLPEHPVASYKYFVGDGIEKLARRAIGGETIDETQLARGIELARAEYARRWDNKSRPYPGIPELLDRLTERKVPMAVFSNKPHDFTRLCVTKLLASWHFQVIQGATPELPKKPDPRGALEVATKLNVAPPDVLYLGDTNTDMWTAAAAGMYPVGALWGFREADELRAAGAKALVEKPQDVLEVLE